jgi:hypothetical protein
MKRFLLVFAVLFSFTCSSFAAQGGPDLYGYTWKDSNEPGGPAYSWWDITGIGQKVHPFLGDDNVSLITYYFGGNFTYYWYPVDHCFISSNGYITFNGDNIASPFPIIPNTAGADNFIGAMMADLNFSGTNNLGECYFWANTDSVCISWVTVPFWDQLAPSFSGSNSFQIILNKVDNSITFNYQTQTGLTMNNDITIGIENINGGIGLQHSKNQYPVANYSVKYYYPVNPTLSVTDAAVQWNDNIKNQGVFIKRNGPVPYSLTTNVANVGNQNLSAFSLTGEVLNSVNTVLMSTTASTLAMNPGDDTTITYPNTFSPSLAGTYSFRTTVSGATGDTIVSNNTITQEVVSVDTAFATITLSYAGVTPNGPGLSWTGGNGGIGVYFKPPTYPARLVSTRYVITANGNNAGFYAKIYADDGPNGSPGTLLDSVSVAAAQVNVGGTTLVPLSQPRMVYSGGVYVLWYMNGLNITIGTDATGPFSFQTYEVLGNIWSEYRSHDTQDFFIALDYQKAVIEDAGVPRVVSPAASSTVTTSTPVQAWIKNYGAGPESNFTANYKYGTYPTVSQAYTGPTIAAGDSVLFTFTTQLSPVADTTFDLCVWTYKSTDFDMSNDTSCNANVTTSTVGIGELAGVNSVHIYPNPSAGKIVLEFATMPQGEVIFELYDMVGRQVMMEAFGNRAGYVIDISAVSEGVYSYRLRNGEHVKSGKIMKSKE